MIGIEAIVACIMSIDKDDPPRRAGSGGSRTRAAYSSSVIMQEGCRCVLCIEKKKASIFLSCSHPKSSVLFTNRCVPAQAKYQFTWWWQEKERRRELQNIIILNGDAT